MRRRPGRRRRTPAALSPGAQRGRRSARRNDLGVRRRPREEERGAAAISSNAQGRRRRRPAKSVVRRRSGEEETGRRRVDRRTLREEREGASRPNQNRSSKGTATPREGRGVRRVFRRCGALRRGGESAPRSGSPRDAGGDPEPVLTCRRRPCWPHPAIWWRVISRSARFARSLSRLVPRMSAVRPVLGRSGPKTTKELRVAGRAPPSCETRKYLGQASSMPSSLSCSCMRCRPNLCRLLALLETEHIPHAASAQCLTTLNCCHAENRILELSRKN